MTKTSVARLALAGVAAALLLGLVAAPAVAARAVDGCVDHGGTPRVQAASCTRVMAWMGGRRRDLRNAFLQRGLARKHTGDLARAVADLDRAVALDPMDASAFAARGHLYALSERPADAVRDFDRAIGLGVPSSDLRVLRGLTLLAVGEPAAAFADFHTALSSTPDDILAARGEAVALASLRILPGEVSPAALSIARAELDLARGCARSALVNLDHALALDPANAYATRLRADALQARATVVADAGSRSRVW